MSKPVQSSLVRQTHRKPSGSKSAPQINSQSPSLSYGLVQRATELPDSLSAADALTLQHSIGNRGTQKLLGSGRSPSTRRFPIHAKLTVGPVGDVYEQEADRVATQVVTANQTQRSPAESASPTSLNQTEEQLQTKSLTPTITPNIQPTSAGAGFEVSGNLESRLASRQGSGQQMPESVQRSMESGFGADFSSVRLHTDSESVQMNREINAQAFTHGSNIYFGASKYNPASAAGQHLLAHELTHVVQQTGPTVRRQVNKDNSKIKGRPSGTHQMIQRKLSLNGEEKNKSDTSFIGETPLNRGQKMVLEGMFDDVLRHYKFANVENLLAYLKKPSDMSLVEIEELQQVAPPPTTTADPKKKETRWGRAILGGLGGLILAPLGAAIGAIGGAVRGAMGGAKSVYNKLAGGSQSGLVKFLSGLAAIGGAAFGLVRGAITGALGGLVGSPALGALAAAPELAEEDPAERKNIRKIPRDDLQTGDIVMVRGGGGVSGGMIIFGQYLHKLWSGKSRGAKAGFRHAGVVISPGMYAHASGGVYQDPIPSTVGDGLFVYRSTNPALARQAAKIAKDWSTFRQMDDKAKIGYSAGKAGDAIFRSSSFNSSRAAVLAAYYNQGITPGDMFCSEFAISVYQAAALQPAIRDLNGSDSAPSGDDKSSVKSWGKRNKDRLSPQGSVPGGLNVDPRRTAPQMLAAELQRGTEGDTPTWQFMGITE